jgi:hypothetical protein
VLFQFGPTDDPTPGVEVVDGAAVGTAPDSGVLACQLTDDRTTVAEASGITPAEAEACRALIYDAAASQGLTCDGDACEQ